METSSHESLVAKLAGYREIFRRKASLRRIYAHMFEAVRTELVAVPGSVVELGCGSGNAKEYLPESMAVDVIPAPWLDVAADARHLPFRDESVSNLVLVDVLHHIPGPGQFLKEAERVLAPGGRIVMVEPAVTPVSWFFYRFLHHEGIDFSVDPLDWAAPDGNGATTSDPFIGNQAVPTLLLRKGGLDAFPGLRLKTVRLMGLAAYPLSGGFQPWSLIPASAVRPLLWLEDKALPVLGKLMAFRMLAVVERAESSGAEAQT